MNASDSPAPILVLGGTGKTGRRIVARLLQRGLPVRVGSRSGEVPFEWTDSSTWPAALDGARAAYICFQPDLAVAGAPEAIAAFTAAALARGVRRLVLLSGRGEDEALRAEQALQASSADWTIVRCSWFMQNFSEGHFRPGLDAGELALPVGDVPEPFVDADDIADVAVAALTDDRHIGQLYELTGPRALSFAEAVAELSRANGRALRYTPIAMADFVDGSRQQGVPEEMIGFLRYLFVEVLDGRNARPADGVARALGRPARDFADFARQALAPD